MLNITYFIVILYNECNLDIQTIAITCMPNGELHDIYGDKVISAGKNKGKIRFNYTKAREFELLEDKPLRTKVLLWNEKMLPQVETLNISSVREGIVVRIDNRPSFTAYKHKNFSFKCLEGIIKDNSDAPDMEEAEELIAEEVN